MKVKSMNKVSEILELEKKTGTISEHQQLLKPLTRIQDMIWN